MIKTRNRGRCLWWLGVVFVVIFRLYLVSHDDIAPVRNDARNYARQTNFYLVESVFADLPQQRPGLSIFAWAAAQIGIPYKVAIDLLLLAVALAAAGIVTQLIGSRLCSFIAFALVSLNPWFFINSEYFMTEPLTSLILLSLFASACSFITWPVRRWSLGNALIAGLVSGLYVLTRSEMWLLLLFWILVIMAAAICQAREFFRMPKSVARCRIALIVVPLFTALGVTQIVKSIHLRHYGVRSLTCTETAGFNALIDALYSIPPAEAKRFAPVTRQSISVACDVSPTMAKYRKRLLDLSAPAYQSALKHLGLENEFGTWLNWHLVRSFRPAPNASASNRDMQTAAADIRQAQTDGRIARRFGRYPIDPLWREWLPHLPMETLKRIGRSVCPSLGDQTRNRSFADGKIVNTVETGFFDNGLLRRKGIGENVALRVFATTPKTGYRRARLLSASGTTLDDVRIINTRDKRMVIGFELTNSIVPISPEPAILELLSHEDEQVKPKTIPLQVNMNHTSVRLDITEKEYEFWHVWVSTTVSKNARLEFLQQTLIRDFDTVFWFSLLVVVLWGAIRGIKPRRLGKLVCFVLVGFGFLLGRSLFYALVEVWLNWGEFRYVESNHLFVMVTLICAAFAVGAWCNRKVAFLYRGRFSRYGPTPA